MAIFGNRGAYYRGNGADGVGTESYPIRASFVTVVGKAGETYYVGIGRILSKDTEVGCFVQTTGAVTIDYTLAHPALATNPDPDVQANVPWVNTQTLAAGSITQANEGMGFNAMRVEFTAPGELYIVGR